VLFYTQAPFQQMDQMKHPAICNKEGGQALITV
jgi:hypothetical protein